ncbi:V-type ATP synthase subunit F [Streptomyces sp. NK08204]|uniref:V-type ATP synthase subunit F n=1 Tax=Streptomyces sp. NK08204 TaxID=2873260 RepID=UPI001CED61FE|nr:V-type ATP synthase subunit F [Streptomyces sp. NK08204]
MGTVAAIGARTGVCGLALAGVDVFVAQDPDAVRRAWAALPRTVGLVILTAEAAETLGSLATAPDPSRPLTVVMP